jgi:hypothetical protein
MNDQRSCIYRRLITAGVIVVGIASPALAARAASDPSLRVQETLLVPEDKPWTAVLAAPVAAHLRTSGRIPIVASFSSPPTHELERLITLASPEHICVFALRGQARLGPALDDRKPELFDLGDGPSVASLRVAKRYWHKAKGVVLAMADDAEGMILGSTVAAVLDTPLLLVEPDQTRLELNAALQSLAVEQAIVAVSDKRKLSPAARELSVTSKVMLPKDMAHCVVDCLGVKNIHTVVVARFPEARSGVGRTAWLAPYMSAVRGAPVVLVRSHAAVVAETDVQQLVEREGLRLRTVTILADYGSIGNNTVTIEGEEGSEDDAPPMVVPANSPPPAVAPSTPTPSTITPVNLTPSTTLSGSGTLSLTLSSTVTPSVTAGSAAQQPAPSVPVPHDIVQHEVAKTHYSFPIEPFLPRDLNKVVPWGVGRIPLESLSDASVLFARGLVRETILSAQEPRMLMVANAGIVRKPLPLCETISRVTADEFKNAGVQTDEFYGKLSDSPEILAAARTAQLVVYEGHTGYQELFNVPPLHRTPPENYDNDELDEIEGDANHNPNPSSGSVALSDSAPVRPAPIRVVPTDLSPARLQGPLTGIPIVVLQGCVSLDEPILWHIDELGGVAVIGSVTAIHSGSGGAYMQALASSWLYRNATLGEGVRDAQNYMFCLEDLKRVRGHKQQAKGMRVALSFRLWGDPELKVFPSLHSRPKLAPVAARWSQDGVLSIQVPKTRLQEEQSAKFVAETFPGSQAAGMVKNRPARSMDGATGEGTPLRELVPVYYFRLPLPDRFSGAGELGVQSSRSASHRVGIRVDHEGKAVCVVYYPEKEIPDDVIELHLAVQRVGQRTERGSE